MRPAEVDDFPERSSVTCDHSFERVAVRLLLKADDINHKLPERDRVAGAWGALECY